MNMKQLIFSIFVFVLVFVATSCEKPLIDTAGDADGNVTLRFTTVTKDMTRGTAASHFDKLNIMMFDADGDRVFDKVKTQTKDDDEDFGTMRVTVNKGTYWIVAVGHSSHNSATIKSPEVVQFTAADGEKLTDTFCHCSQITIDEDTEHFDLSMYRVGAMIQFCLNDDTFPVNFTHFKMDYTGGSANFNPQTLQGITKSTQSEKRATNGIHIYQCFTFPYLSETGTITMICTALDMDGNVIRKRKFENVPVQRNRITTYNGHFFMDGDGDFSMSDFGFVIHADWDGETQIDF